MNEYPFHPVDNETTRKQALIDYEAKLKGEGLAPIEWTYIVDGREVQLSEDSEKALGDRAIRFFESFISYDHDRDRGCIGTPAPRACLPYQLGIRKMH